MSRKDRVTLEDGMELRLLSAQEVLEARREAGELAQGTEERALCANACLLARALEENKAPVFASGREVLEHLSAREVARLAQLWDALDRAENPSPEDGEQEAQALKKALSTRLMNAFAGVCSSCLGRFRPSRGSGR